MKLISFLGAAAVALVAFAAPASAQTGQTEARKMDGTTMDVTACIGQLKAR